MRTADAMYGRYAMQWMVLAVRSGRFELPYLYDTATPSVSKVSRIPSHDSEGVHRQCRCPRVPHRWTMLVAPSIVIGVVPVGPSWCHLVHSCSIDEGGHTHA